MFAKGLAVLLLCAMALICIASAGGALYLSERGAYTMGYDAAAREAVDGIGNQLSREAADKVRFGTYEDGSKPVVKPKRLKVGRNDPCPCGSGKKYKNCCGKNA